MRIGQIGQRIDFFWSTIIDEADLLERFGVQVLPIDLLDLIRQVRSRTAANRKDYQEELARFRPWVSFNHFQHEDDILANFAFRDLMVEMAREHDIDGFCIQTFSSIPNELSAFLAFGCCLVDDAGYPVAPESDVHGAISSLLLEAASDAGGPSFSARHHYSAPRKRQCCVADALRRSLVASRPDSPVKLDRPWVLKSLPTGLVHFRLKDGPLTLCRFAGSSQGYRLGCGEGRTVPGPYTEAIYAWMEVDDWPRWERNLICGPYIHHCSCVYDHCANILQEAARYIPHLECERFDGPENAFRSNT